MNKTSIITLQVHARAGGYVIGAGIRLYIRIYIIYILIPWLNVVPAENV